MLYLDDKGEIKASLWRYLNFSVEYSLAAMAALDQVVNADEEEAFQEDDEVSINFLPYY